MPSPSGVKMARRRSAAHFREALDDHFSDGDMLKPEAAFKRHRKEIEALARRKYLYGEREPDGSVLLRMLDIA